MLTSERVVDLECQRGVELETAISEDDLEVVVEGVCDKGGESCRWVVRWWKSVG